MSSKTSAGKTDSGAKAAVRAEKAVQKGVDARASAKKSKEETPMKRPAQPEEIAPAYVLLASAQCSSFITGEILPIIGGYSGG